MANVGFGGREFSSQAELLTWLKQQYYTNKSDIAMLEETVSDLRIALLSTTTELKKYYGDFDFDLWSESWGKGEAHPVKKVLDAASDAMHKEPLGSREYIIVYFHADGGQYCDQGRRVFTSMDKAEKFAEERRNERDHVCGPKSVRIEISDTDPGDEGIIYPGIAER